jgi:hypothetical protein
MNEIGSDGMLRHAAPTHIVMRVFLAAIGVFILVMSTRELFRGVWPPNLFSAPFLLILVGALAVGGGMIFVGLFGPSLQWTVGRGLIEIVSTNPFGVRRHRFTAADIDRFVLSEYDGDGGYSTWKVLLVTKAGKRFESSVFRTRQAAEDLKLGMEQAFYA